MPTRGDNDSTPEEGQAKEKSSFLKKRTKKLSILQGRVARIGRIKRGTKVFWFFQKKKYFLASLVCDSLGWLVLRVLLGAQSRWGNPRRIRPMCRRAVLFRSRAIGILAMTQPHSPAYRGRESGRKLLRSERRNAR
jgi:hypothetical protein